MKIKYVIFLLVATVALSSVAQNSSTSCVPVTHVADDLEVIQYAHDVTHRTLVREAEISFTLIRTLLAERARQIHVNPEYAESRFAHVLNQALTAGTRPIIPVLEAIRTIQPRIDMESNIQQATVLVTSLVRNTFNGIKLTQGINYSEALAAIEESEKRACADSDSYIQEIFNALLNGTVEVPHEAKTATACAHAKAAFALRNGISGILNGAKILLKANFCQNETEINSYSSQIEDAFNKVIEEFNGEVAIKFAAFRNLVIAASLKKIGIVQGLFAIQAIPFKNYV